MLRNMIEGVPLFTAAQIALAAGLSRQAIQAGLERIQPDGQLDVDGTPCPTWRFERLPLEWQEKIIRRAHDRRFENAGALMASCPLSPWNPPIPWDRICPREQRKASRLQKAMARALALRESPEREPAGLEDFRAEFGYEISARHWRRILARTLSRDGGEENFQRLEIYLDDRAFVIPKVNPDATRDKYRDQHRGLVDTFSAVPDRLKLTADNVESVWRAVIDHYEEFTGALPDSPSGNQERRQFKASLLDYVFKAFPAGTLCASAKSLRKRFDEKIQTLRGGGILYDRRRDNSGRPGRRPCPTCLKLYVDGAVSLDGDQSQAYRRLKLGKTFCGDCDGIGRYDVRRNKSDVPGIWRRLAAPEIEKALPHRRGKKHARLHSPYTTRDWSDIGPGVWAECDDMTPNHVVSGAVESLFVWDQDRHGRRFVGRMEVLFQYDRRTEYPLGYIIIMGDPATPETPQRKATYNSAHCRLLFLRSHDAMGIPHKGGGFYLENSIWGSQLIDGPRVNKWANTPWASVERGLRDPRLDLQVRHALPGNPRSKIIERVFRTAQDRMRCQPGFVGFNERTDKRQHMDELVKRVKAGKEHPGNDLPSVGEFRNLLDAELLAIASEPQNGGRLPGVSPLEAFYGGIDGWPGIKQKPLRKLGDEARFLLSTYERVSTVGPQGIKYSIGGVPFVFWCKELEPYQNRQIVTRFNFEEPEILTCQAPDRPPFTVKAKILKSTTATREELAEIARQRASWMRPGKMIMDNMQHPFRASIARDTDHSVETRDLGRFHNEQVEAYREEKSESTRKEGRARRLVEDAGIDSSLLPLKRTDQVAESAARIPDRKAALRAKEAAENSTEPTHE
jgi:hypothetical protein